MEEVIFKTKPSATGFIRFWIMRIIAAATVIFSIYSFQENTVFFSIFIASSAAVFLLCGSKQISIYKTYINIHTDSLLKNTPLSRKFLLNEIKEISAEYTGEVSEIVLPIFIRYRLVIVGKDDIQRTFLLMTTPEDLEKSVSIINDMRSSAPKFQKIAASPLVS